MCVCVCVCVIKQRYQNIINICIGIYMAKKSLMLVGPLSWKISLRNYYRKLIKIPIDSNPLKYQDSCKRNGI